MRRRWKPSGTEPVRCKACGALVFYHANDRGDIFVFNRLGWPWRLHPCHLAWVGGKLRGDFQICRAWLEPRLGRSRPRPRAIRATLEPRPVPARRLDPRTGVTQDQEALFDFFRNPLTLPRRFDAISFGCIFSEPVSVDEYAGSYDTEPIRAALGCDRHHRVSMLTDAFVELTALARGVHRYFCGSLMNCDLEKIPGNNPFYFCRSLATIQIRAPGVPQ